MIYRNPFRTQVWLSIYYEFPRRKKNYLQPLAGTIHEFFVLLGSPYCLLSNKAGVPQGSM